MTDTSTADTGPMPVFSGNGTMQGNLTSAQGQPPAPAGGAPALAPQSPLNAVGPPPTPTAGPPPDQSINYPPQPAKPSQQKLGPPPDAKDYQQSSMAFASAMAVLGAVASKFTRVSGTAALSAFAGALNGWKTGNLQAYEEDSKKWEQQTKATIENNRQILEDYRLTIENNKMNIDQQMSELNLKSAKWHDQMMYDATKQKNFTFAMQIYEKNWDYTNGPKGLEATAAPLIASIKNDHAKQAFIGERVASGQIDPDGVNPQTGQPYSEKDKLYFKYTKDKYLSGFYGDVTGQKTSSVGKSAIAQDRQQYINEQIEATGVAPSSEQITQWEADRAGKITEAGTVARRAGGIAVAVQEAHDTVPNVQAAAEKSAGKGLAVWNAAENKWNVQKGDENYAYYVQQLNSLINVYGRVISGGGKGTVSDLEHAREMLNPNMPLSAVKGALRGFSTEIDIAEKAPEKVRARMHGGKETPAQTTNAPGAPAGGAGAIPPGWDVQVH